MIAPTAGIAARSMGRNGGGGRVTGQASPTPAPRDASAAKVAPAEEAIPPGGGGGAPAPRRRAREIPDAGGRIPPAPLRHGGSVY